MTSQSLFELSNKKQVLMFQLLSLLHARRTKFKTGLKANYTAQTIIADLDESVDRNLDYLVAVNTLTTYLLLVIGKPQEALEFVNTSQKFIFRLLEAFVKLQQLETIGERDSLNENT